METDSDNSNDWIKPPPSEIPPPLYEELETKKLREKLKAKSSECQYWQQTASQQSAMYQYAIGIIRQQRDDLYYTIANLQQAQKNSLGEECKEECNQFNAILEECNQLRDSLRKQETTVQKLRQKKKQLKNCLKNENNVHMVKAKAEMATRERDSLRVFAQKVKQTLFDFNDFNDCNFQQADQWEQWTKKGKLLFTQLKLIVDPPKTKRLQALPIEELEQDTLYLYEPHND